MIQPHRRECPRGIMTQESKELDATWLGTALTLATAAAAIVAVLFPEERPLLWVLVVMFAVGALLCFRRAHLLSSQRSRLLVGAAIVAFILLAVIMGHDQRKVPDIQAPIAPPLARQLAAQPSVEAKQPAKLPLKPSLLPVAPRPYQVITISRDEIQLQLDARSEE